MISQSDSPGTEIGRVSRLHLDIRGAVQGIGFRPFVYRLAAGMGLTGWVCNTIDGVRLEVEGDEDDLGRFQARLRDEIPALAVVTSVESLYLDPVGFEHFEIRESESGGESPGLVLPDIATCQDCLNEILDPRNRRYRYPFTNCTNCGPRYSIIEDLPYDRRLTTMKGFRMCPACQAEYDDPSDRRFHAQPNACPVCGPQLILRDVEGLVRVVRDEALEMAVEALRAGSIVAVKGVGGYHLMVDAGNGAAITELRRRKHRSEKPLALLYPNLDEVRRDCIVSSLEERLLCGPEAPIVLLEQRGGVGRGRPSAELIAPGVSSFGVMLPSTPLHHLLLRQMGGPVVATSGNLADEPICTADDEALTRLAGIADLFLAHDRPIRRHVDDSIVRVMAGRMMILRRARGYAPLPITVGGRMDPVLATGAQLKNCIALASGDQVILSQHIGDLETGEALHAFEKVIGDFVRFYRREPVLVVHDSHPDYHSTRHPATLERPRLAVQHHYAHALSCLADNRLAPPALGVAWDGTGYGDDGTIWGGEFLLIDDSGYERRAHWRTFPLPGGEIAIREPRRAAIGLLHEIMGDGLFDQVDLAPRREFGQHETEIVRTMLARRINCPRTSSVGRLFDAVASLVGLRHVAKYEGQAAIELEHALQGVETTDSYPVHVTVRGQGGAASSELEGTPHRTMILDWEPMVRKIIGDISAGVQIPFLSAKFHNTLVESLVTIAGLVGQRRVCLTGGCFQNRYLTERAIRRLREEGFEAYWHQRVPPNDGGIALGQALAAARFRKQI